MERERVGQVGSPVVIRDLHGGDILPHIDALADLRMRVFRAFPYLYEGDRDYERHYLTAYAQSAGAYVAGAFARSASGEEVLVGAATATPMVDHADDFAEPFLAAGMDIATIYYFGESVLLPQWRGHGVGHAFFERREAAARARGFPLAAFCAVVRPVDHPDRPGDYSPLDPLWRRHGFAPVDGLVCQFDWKDVGQAAESSHPMQFWIKALG